MSIRIIRNTLILLLCVSNTAFSEWADNDKMVMDTLSPFVPKDSEARRDTIEHARLNIADAAWQRPNERRAATIIFSTGKSTDDVVDLSRFYDVAIVEVQLKAPLNDQGIVHTVLIGTDDLMAIDAPLADQLEHTIQVVRERMLDTAAAMSDERAAGDFRRMALGPQLIYSIQIVGTGRSISEVAHSPEVAAAFLHWSNARVLELDSLEAHQAFEHLSQSRLLDQSDGSSLRVCRALHIFCMSEEMSGPMA